jgi:hypothetical protein
MRENRERRERRDDGEMQAGKKGNGMREKERETSDLVDLAR